MSEPFKAIKKKRTVTKRPEQVIQIHVAKHLMVIEAYTKNIKFFHPANGGYRTPAEANIFKTLGVRAGVPDLVIGMKGGKTIYIELKAGKKKPSDKQSEFMEGLNKLGFSTYLVCAMSGVDAIKQITQILKDEGLEGVR